MSALLFVALAVPLAILPVPFVAWSPGGTADVLGDVDGRPLISVEGVPTFPTAGQLDLTVVSGTSADSRLTLPEALAAYWLPGRDTLPRDAVFPPGQSADDVTKAESQMMETSQDDAVVAALRAAGQPVEQRPAVSSVTMGGPAYGKLLPGDLIVSVDGVDTPDADAVGDQIRGHRPNEPVDFVVLRDRVKTTVRGRRRGVGDRSRGRGRRHHDRSGLRLRAPHHLRPRPADRRYPAPAWSSPSGSTTRSPTARCWPVVTWPARAPSPPAATWGRSAASGRSWRRPSGRERRCSSCRAATAPT